MRTFASLTATIVVFGWVTALVVVPAGTLLAHNATAACRCNGGGGGSGGGSGGKDAAPRGKELSLSVVVSAMPTAASDPSSCA